MITGFFVLGLNRYSKKKECILFENETWLTFSKGYPYFPGEYAIQVKDTINIKDLAKGNYQAVWWNNFIIKNKIDKKLVGVVPSYWVKKRYFGIAGNVLVLLQLE